MYVYMHVVVLKTGNMYGRQNLGCIEVTRTEGTVLLPLTLDSAFL